MIKGQITLTFFEIFLNNISTPSNFIQFHFNKLPNTQFFFFEKAKMNYITTAKKAFLAQGVLEKTKSIQSINNNYKAKANTHRTATDNNIKLAYA